MKRPDKFVVYALRDPRDQSIRYVGKSANGLAQRMRQHLGPSGMMDTCPRAMWIKELIALNLAPKAEVIEVCKDAPSLAAREMHWIEFYAGMGLPLMNVKDTGKTLDRQPTHRGVWGVSPAAQQLVLAMVEKVYSARISVEHGNRTTERPLVKAAGARVEFTKHLHVVSDALDRLEADDPLVFEVMVGRACGFSNQRMNASLRARGRGVGSVAMGALIKAGVAYVWARLEGRQDLTGT